MSLREASRKFSVPLSTIKGWYNGKTPLFKFKNGLVEKKNIKQISKNSSEITPEKSYILGVLCGDGYLSSKDGYISLEVIDDDFIQEFKNCITQVYGPNFEGSIKNTKGRKKRLLVVGIKMVRNIEDDLPKSKTLEWRVPKKLFISNDICRSYFLKGIFDSDGSVHGKHSLDLTSTNFNGLNDIKRLLETIDIISSEVRKDGSCYKLYITSKENILKFHKKVGFSISKKSKKLNNLVMSYNN